jgi:polysaccharide pyruvyl transferase WcaK-like protein
MPSSNSKVGKSPPRILLFGYNGANNTGSEARLIAIIEDVRKVFGPDAVIIVPTLNEANLRRYMKEDEHLRIAPIPSIFFFALRRLVKHSDLVMLVEGSCFMDTWAGALLLAFLSSSKYAESYHIPMIAYAVDSGKLSDRWVKRVRKEASKIDLLITRTEVSADRLRKWGVTAPIEVTDDTAFTLDLGTEDGTLRRLWPESRNVAGMAVVDFNIWPVVIRPFGRRRDCYRWPYYFSRSKERREASEQLAGNLAAEADHLVESHDKFIALIAMEAVDEHLARRVRELMRYQDRAKMFSSNDHDAATMTRILRSLDLLITSRYHASVLSMAGGVPQVALGHDLRLHDFYKESGLLDEFFIKRKAEDAWERLRQIDDRLVNERESLRQRILLINAEHETKARRNVELLREFALKWGLPVVG